MRRPPREAGPACTAADAALLLAVVAVVAGPLAVLLAALECVLQSRTGLLGAVTPAGVVSWILAVAAVWTAIVVRRRDRVDRRARLAVRMSAPGAVAGTLAVVGLALSGASTVSGMTVSAGNMMSVQ